MLVRQHYKSPAHYNDSISLRRGAMEKLCFLIAQQLIMSLIARLMPVILSGCFERERLNYHYLLIYLISVFCSFIIMFFSK